MSTALITGASAGLGSEFARLFAADGHDLILVARRRDRLDVLAAELAAKHQRQVHVIALDLGTADATDRLMAELGKLGVEIDFLVNNAGFGQNGAFHELPAARQLEMVQLNVTTLVALTHALLPGMVARKRGRVLNIGSTAGFQPGPFMAVYYASKAFVNSFTEALAFELRGTGVTATVSCPGATATEFAATAGNDKSMLFRMGAATAESVARQAYRAMMKGRAIAVPGVKNKLLMQSLRVSPRSTVRRLAAAINRTPRVGQLEPPR